MIGAEKMAKRIWLVTGAAGFIGSNIAEELANRGEKVVGIDNFITGKKEHIKNFSNRIKFIRADIRNIKALYKVMKGITYVLHQAALRSVPKSVNDPFSSHDHNVTGTLNVFLSAKKAGVKRVVSASSSSIYGDSKIYPQKESHFPAPISPYAASKLSGEHYARVFSKTMGLEVVSLRYFNVYGPRQDPESLYSAVIPKFMEQAMKGKPLEVHWDGKQTRDFTYVSDVVDANIRSALKPGIGGEIFNIAGGKKHSLLDLIKIIENILGKKLPRRHTPPRAGDVRQTWADMSKARRILGWHPRTSFEKGLTYTWQYFSTHKNGS